MKYCRLYFNVDTKVIEPEKAMVEAPFEIQPRTWFFHVNTPILLILIMKKGSFSANCSLCELLWIVTYQNTFWTNKLHLISSRLYCHLKDTNMCELDYKLSNLSFNSSLSLRMQKHHVHLWRKGSNIQNINNEHLKIS